MKRALLWVLLFLAVVGGGVTTYVLLTRRSKEPRWITQPIRRGDVSQVVSATGILQPLVLSPVGSQVSGIVWKVHADYNTEVKKGQILVELDPAIFQTQVAREQANLKAAQADVQRSQAQRENTKLIAGRARALFEKHYIAASEKDTAEAQERQAEAEVGAALARVQQTQAALRKVQLDLHNSVILSPVDGIVIARNVEVGQAVVASFQAPNLFTIAQDLKQMQVLANVDEADIGMVQLGQQATFTVDAFRGRRFSAQVSQVRNAAQSVQNVVTYVVVLNVDNRDLLLKPGMTANVRMEVASRSEVLLVQNAALRFRPRQEGKGETKGAQDGQKGESKGESKGAMKGANNGERWQRRQEGAAPGAPPAIAGRGLVYVMEGEGKDLRSIPVVTGVTDGSVTEIVKAEGLAEGTQVVVDMARQGGTSGPSATPFGGAQPPRGGMRRAGF